MTRTAYMRSKGSTDDTLSTRLAYFIIAGHISINFLPSSKLQGEVTQQVVIYHMIGDLFSVIGSHRLACCLVLSLQGEGG